MSARRVAILAGPGGRLAYVPMATLAALRRGETRVAMPGGRVRYVRGAHVARWPVALVFDARRASADGATRAAARVWGQP